jgi:ATP-dependent RNA helicase DeaD
VEEARTTVFLDKIRATLLSGEFKRHDHLVELLLEEGFTSTDIASALIHHLQAADGAAAAGQKPRSDGEPKRPSRQHEPREYARERRSPRLETRRAERDISQAEQRRVPQAEQKLTLRSRAASETSAERPRSPVLEQPHPKSPQEDKKRAAAPKQSRSTPLDKTRLYINVGSRMGVAPRDIVGAISIIAKLNRTRIKEHRIKVKVA